MGKGSRKRKEQRSHEEAEVARQVMGRAIKRLNILEYLILGFALILALGGGALVAWMLSGLTDLSFRWSWAGASLFLFILPGAFVYFREIRKARPGS